MRNGNFWYKWYPEKFDSDVKFLSFDQESLYRKLIDLLYQESGTLPLNHESIAMVCKIPVERFKELFNSIEKYFDLDDGAIKHNKVSIELHKQNIASDEQSYKGKIGAAIKYVSKEIDITDDDRKELMKRVTEDYPRKFIIGLDKGTLRKTLKGLLSNIYSSSSDSISLNNNNTPTNPFNETDDIPKSAEDNLEDPNFSNALKQKVEELNESYVWTSADQHESNELERIIKKVVSKKSDNPKIELLIKCFELVYQDMGDFHHKNFGIGYMVRNWNKCYQAAKIEKDNRKKIASQR